MNDFAENIEHLKKKICALQLMGFAVLVDWENQILHVHWPDNTWDTKRGHVKVET